jgi:hypothetical protein
MTKLLWGTALFIALFVLQIKSNSLSLTTSVLSTSLSVDSTRKILIESADIPNIDVLQESLYVLINEEIENPKQNYLYPFPQNEAQLLAQSQKYYPKAKLSDNTLVIPYPQHIVNSFNELRYNIPTNYFTNNSLLEPLISLDLNPEKSTLKINNSYIASYYRSPGIRSNSVKACQKALKIIYNLILPPPFKSRAMIKQKIMPVVYYKGYQAHEIKLSSDQKFAAFWRSLHEQGSVYFYPSKFDELEENVQIFGLLYIIKDNVIDIHHFGELTVQVSKNYQNTISEFRLVFYPFIKNIN